MLEIQNTVTKMKNAEECPLIVSSLKITEKKFDELKIHQIELTTLKNGGKKA